MLVKETGMQRFEPAADDDYAAIDGEQRALARLAQKVIDANLAVHHALTGNGNDNANNEEH